MSKRKPKDIAASVRQRLYDLSRTRGDEFQLVLTHYAIERLLYRLSKSPHADRFVLKGAMLFSVWTDKPYRPTRDLDLLGRGESAPDRVADTIKTICQQPVEDDGLIFNADSVRAEPIREDQEYEGVRVVVLAMLGNAKIPLQVDIGFGDSVVPAEEELTYPTLLVFPAPELKSYPKESVIAEKFQAMVALGPANSRMKDFYDVWMLARRFEFDGETVSRAIKSTFERRQTALPTGRPYALSDECVGDKQGQWSAFQNRVRLLESPASFAEVIELIGEFLLPPAQAASSSEAFVKRWRADGTWG